MDWRSFFEEHQTLLEQNYPGLTLSRFLREAGEIGGDGEAFLRGIPFAYLLGYAEFGPIKLKVTPDTLIPRPETEQLYELVCAELSAHPHWRRAVDVGTGPGTLGLALAKTFPKLQLTLTDVSEAALAVCRENVALLGPKDVRVLESDLLAEVVGLFDLIVSNPPYIPASSRGVHPKTHEFEPHLALYLGDEEYDAFFQRFFHQVARRLTQEGSFFMEGHEDRLDELARIADAERLTSVSVLRDLSGRKRFLRARAPRVPIG